jgi:hypothetical protein
MAVDADPTSATSSAAPDTSLGSALCTQCGLCCTGALHNAAVLDPDEIAAARALNLPVLDTEKPKFALPCPRLDGTLCTIYGNRPRVCGRYKCQLLQDLEAGAVGLDDALGKVGIAKALRREAEAAMPPGMTLPQARKLAHTSLADRANVATAGEDMQLVLRTAALNLYLDRHFRNSRDGRAYDVTVLGERTVAADGPAALKD